MASPALTSKLTRSHPHQLDLDMAQLHDLSNEIILLILMETDVKSLLNLATLSRNLNHLAVIAIFSLADVSLTQDEELEISPETIEKGIIRALNIEIPGRNFSRIQVRSFVSDAPRILRETTNFLQKSTKVSHFRLSASKFAWEAPTRLDKEWADLLASISKHLRCVSLSLNLSDARQHESQVSDEDLTPLVPMRHLESISINTGLIDKPHFHKWFIESMNSSPLRELILHYWSNELLQNLHLNQLEKLTIRVVDIAMVCEQHRHTFADMHQFLKRHCHITSLHISGWSETMPSALPPLLFNNLTQLAMPAIHFPSCIPISTPDLKLYGYKQIKLLRCCTGWPGPSPPCTHLEDAIDSLGTPGGGTFMKVHFDLDDEVPEWMKRQVINSPSHTVIPLMDVTSLEVAARFDMRDLLVCWIGLRFTELEELSISFNHSPSHLLSEALHGDIRVVPLLKVRSLDLRLSAWCDLQSLRAILPKFIGLRFPQLEECSITFWDSGFVREGSQRPSQFLGVKVIWFVRALVRECPMLDYVQLNHDRKHSFEWMIEDVEGWDDEKEEKTLKLMAEYYTRIQIESGVPDRF